MESNTMFDIDIYIENTWHSPAKKAGAAAWLVAYQGKELHTEQRILWMNNGTENAAEVKSLRMALSTLTRPCNITVHTTCGYLYGALNGWMEKWSADDWKRKDGELISYAADWQWIAAALTTHTCKVQKDAHHPFTDVMRQALRRQIMLHVER